MKSGTTLIGGDAIVITLFVLLGLNNHEGISLAGWARNAIPLTSAWLVVGGALGVYRTEIAGNLPTILQRTAIAWPVAAIIGLVARYLVIGHGLEASFIIVTILINLVMLLLWRAAYAFALRTKRGEASS